MSKRKAPGEHDRVCGEEKSTNAKIAGFLYELANYEKNVNRAMHKHNAYRKAASIIANHSQEIKSGDQAKKLDGVGERDKSGRNPKYLGHPQIYFIANII